MRTVALYGAPTRSKVLKLSSNPRLSSSAHTAHDGDICLSLAKRDGAQVCDGARRASD